MPRPTQESNALAVRLEQIAGWQTATRNDAKVAQELHEKRAVDRVYALDEAAFFDTFFEYIREIGAWALLTNLDPKTRTGPLISFIRFVLFTIMRCVGGVPSQLATHDLILTDEALMGVLGFNAVQVKEGCNQRGLDRRTKPVEIRGPFSYETAADAIVEIGLEALEAMFNGVIRCLAAVGIFPKEIDAVLDCTDNEATPKYKTDDGQPVPRVTREKRPDVRANRHAKKIKVTVFGWKVWVVWEPTTKIPLALAIDRINESDNRHAAAVMEKAKQNVAGYARIRSVALDRGFLDGKLLSDIEKDDVKIYIPSKSNMTITKDAREIARRAAAEVARGRTVDGCVYRERHETVTRGAGKNARQVILTTTVVGIRDLPCDWWNPEGSTSKANSKNFQPKLVNAVVVLRWDNAPKDAEKEVVILTTDPTEDPFAVFDAYDRRSLIENSCNREAKEHWFLESHPKRSEAGVRVYTYFVFVCMALVAGFRIHMANADQAKQRGQETGIHRYRRQLERENRDKIAVFIGDHFGIFRNFEFALLAGISVREQEILGETVETVLHRYGVHGPQPGTS